MLNSRFCLFYSRLCRSAQTFFLCFLAGAVLLACGGCGESSSSSGGTSKTLTSIAVSAASGTVNAGATDQLTATATYSDGSTSNVTTTVTWTSAQPAVATVSSSGLVTGVAAGTAQETATLNSISGSTTITVPAAAVTLSSITVTPAGLNLIAGGTQQLTATATYSDGSTANVTATATWSSSNAAIVAINSSGLASALSAGTATATATVNGVSGTTMITVVAPAKTLSGVTVAPVTAMLAAGSTQQFAATAAYSDGSTANVTTSTTWISSAASVLTINAAGTATAVAAGSATVTASYQGKTATAAVTVSAAQKTLNSLTLMATSTSVYVGDTLQLTATATYSDNSTANVTAQVAWSSSNSQVATVNASGMVTGVAAGSATVTGSLDGKSATEPLTVAAKTISSIAVTPSPASVELQSTQQLTATATYTDHSTANVTGTVTWSVANADVATVSTSGLLTPQASGTTSITATLNGSSATDAVSVLIAPGTGVTIPTWQDGVTRQGLNDSEQSLTPANVGANSFGKLFSYTLDGYAYAEPLLVSNLQVNGSTHNVLFAATENDSVYAFDADSYGNGQPLWHTSLLQSGETPLKGAPIQPVLGVTSTPVIDPTTQTMYVVSAQNSTAAGSTFRLNALDITTGAQKPGSPITIHASVPGTNSDSVNGMVTLTNSCVQRAALLLANGNIYIGFGSCHSGWLLAYNASTLAQVGVFNSSPNLNGEGAYASAGGIWMGGGGPAEDSNGNVYVVTGNGPWDGKTAFGDTVLKFNPTLSSVTDLFTPDTYAYLNCNDTDLAAGGVTLLPGGTQLVAGGKSGMIYLVNLNPGSLGGEQANDAGVGQEIEFNQGLTTSYLATCTDSAGTHQAEVNSYEIFGTGASYNGSLYLGATPTATQVPGGVREFTYSGGMLTPGVESSPSILQGSYGTTPFISADGTSNGILWMIDHGSPLQSATPTTATLRAYNAENMSSQLYNSSMNSADIPGYGIKFTSPIVGNGKVYISTGMDPVGNGARGEIDVYGLK